MIRTSFITLGGLALASPATAQQALVLNRGDHTATVLELTSGRVVWSSGVGVDPHELARSPDGRFAFVSSYGSNVVHVLDIQRHRTSARFSLGDRTRLHGIWTGRVEPVVWVTAEESRSLLEIDTRQGVVTQVWDTDQEMSHMVVGTPDDAKLYVANVGSGSVSIINRRVGTVEFVPTGAGAEGIDIAPSGDEVWVCNGRSNTISVIDVASDRVVASFSSHGEFPVKLRFSPDGTQVWVSNNRSGTVAVLDATSRQLIETIAVGPRPLGLAFSPDSRYALVTVPGSNELLQIAVADRTIIRRVQTGRGPDGVAWIGSGKGQ